MQVKLVLRRGGKSQTFRVSAPVAIIGRAHGNAVRIPSALVSRQHCRLRLDGGVVHVEDLGSINGTFLNGKRITGREVVRPGDELEVGPVRFVVEYDIAPSVLARLKKRDDDVMDVEEVEDVEEVREVGDFLDGLADGSLIDQVEEIDDVELVLGGGDEPVDDLPVLEVAESDDFKPLPDAPADKNKPDFSFNQPWQMPDAGDLRDILSQMEQDDRPPPPPPKKKKK